MKKRFKVLISIILIAGIFALISIAGINEYVKASTEKRIITPDEAAKLTDADCIIVLGCLVKNNGKPSDMLADRLMMGTELYENKAAPKIIMSGDHGKTTYDEVNAMKKYATDKGIPSSDVFMDHAGFSTYESIYRARDIFKAEKIVIVSQKYHLHRALHIAKKLGVEAYGVSSDYHTYVGQSGRELREILARCKDFIKTIFKPEPTFLGEVIPVSGDGNITND